MASRGSIRPSRACALSGSRFRRWLGAIRKALSHLPRTPWSQFARRQLNGVATIRPDQRARSGHGDNTQFVGVIHCVHRGQIGRIMPFSSAGSREGAGAGFPIEAWASPPVARDMLPVRAANLVRAAIRRFRPWHRIPALRRRPPSGGPPIPEFQIRSSGEIGRSFRPSLGQAVQCSMT
jgi:hypothetical protein